MSSSGTTTSTIGETKADSLPSAVSSDFKRAAELLQGASAILIAAGAGMSVPSGINYNDTEGFKIRYPGMAAKGYRCCYELIGEPLEDEYKWGYGAVHASWMMTHGVKDKTYGDLKNLVAEKPHFVITTNTDGMFTRNGFSTENIYTPQGSYGLMQCMSDTCRHVFDSRPAVSEMLKNTDLSSTTLSDLSKIPVCPKCGSKVYFNLNGGKWYVSFHWDEQRKKYLSFIDEHKRKGRLVILEIGVGYNTPGVIRWPMEKLAAREPNVDIIRVNLDHLEFDAGVPDQRAATLGMDASTAISGLLAAAAKQKTS